MRMIGIEVKYGQVKKRPNREHFDLCMSSTMLDIVLSRAELTEREAKEAEANSYHSELFYF